MLKIDNSYIENCLAEIYNNMGFPVEYYISKETDDPVDIYGKPNLEWEEPPLKFNAVIHKEEEQEPLLGTQARATDNKNMKMITIKFVARSLDGGFPKTMDKVVASIYGEKKDYLIVEIDKNIELLDVYFRVTMAEAKEVIRFGYTI